MSNDDSMSVDWELSQTLESDGQGVRAACVLPPKTGDTAAAYRIVTGTQGGALIEFSVPSGDLNLVQFQHNHAITALLSTTGTETTIPQDEPVCYVTGCKDAAIRILDGNTHELIATLKGHEKPVTSLAWTFVNKKRYLVSGSWDGSAKVWDWEQRVVVATLPNHENSVCVWGGESNEAGVLLAVTGSAGIAQNNAISNHTVRLWKIDVTSSQVTMVNQVANEHDGPIRDVTRVGNFFATCSNDGTVKLRSVSNGKAESTLTFTSTAGTGQAPILLSVASITSEELLAASAEDGHVVIWNPNGTADPTVIRHAACVWKVLALPDNDLATCSQDGALRIFTRATDRMATDAERQAFASAVSEALVKQTQGPSADEISRLPVWERNMEKQGTSEGQVQVFQKNGVAIAAQWSMASQTWIEVGQVMGSASQDTGEIDGVQYDHVFDIEVDASGGGVARLKIGMNNGENPFVAAQRFIDAHMLPQYHLAEIANYLEQRVASSAPTLGGPTPAATSNLGATAGVPLTSFEHVPSKGYKVFGLTEKAAATTLGKMKTKVEEFGLLSSTHLGSLERLMKTLARRDSAIADDELAVIAAMLEFPTAQTFPGLDLARMAVLHADAADAARQSYWEKVMTQALTLCQVASTTTLEGPAGNAIPMLTMRLFCNAFEGGQGSLTVAVAHLDTVLTLAESHVNSTNKNVRLSVATLLHNVCYFLNQQKSTLTLSCIPKIVPLVASILSNKSYEGEAVTRTLVAVGTLILTGREAKDASNQAYLASKVEMAASPHGPVAKAAAREVYALLA